MKLRHKLNHHEIKRLVEWKKQINEAKKNKLEHYLQYYVPYVKIDDVNSISRRHLYWCPVQKRLVHLLSDGEARAYKYLIYSLDVIGIREQFPLHLPKTLQIALEQNIVHPRNWKTREVYVMTTDLLIDRVDFDTGEIYQEARNYKYWDQIYEYTDDGVVAKKRWRTWQKARIEELYWAEKGVATIQMTERDATKVAVQNITWFKMRQDLEVEQEELALFKRAFIKSYKENVRAWLEDHLFNASKLIGISFRDAQALFQFAAFHHELDLNIEIPIRLAEPLVVYN